MERVSKKSNRYGESHECNCNRLVEEIKPKLEL